MTDTDKLRDTAWKPDVKLAEVIRLRADLADRDKTIAELVAANTRLVGLVEGARDANSIVAALEENPDGGWSETAFNIQGVRVTNGDLRRARKWLEDVE